MIYDWYDCDGTFYFKQPGPPWTPSVQWTYDGATLVDTQLCSDDTSPQTRTHRMDFTATRQITVRVSSTVCPPSGNGDDLFECMGGNPTTATCGAVGTHDLANV